MNSIAPAEQHSTDVRWAFAARSRDGLDAVPCQQSLSAHNNHCFRQDTCKWAAFPGSASSLQTVPFGRGDEYVDGYTSRATSRDDQASATFRRHDPGRRLPKNEARISLWRTADSWFRVLSIVTGSGTQAATAGSDVASYVSS